MPEELFSVYQWLQPFQRDSELIQERVREHVTGEEALEAFIHYTSNVASLMGVTRRVIVTDALDRVVAEWIQGQGVVFPKGLRAVYQG